MTSHYPSLLPALAGMAAVTTTIELGPHAASLCIALANIAAATLTTLVLQKCKQHLRQNARKLQPPHIVLTRPPHHKVQKLRRAKAPVIKSKPTSGVAKRNHEQIQHNQ